MWQPLEPPENFVDFQSYAKYKLHNVIIDLTCYFIDNFIDNIVYFGFGRYTVCCARRRLGVTSKIMSKVRLI